MGRTCRRASSMFLVAFRLGGWLTAASLPGGTDGMAE